MDTGPVIRFLTGITELSAGFIGDLHTELKQEFYKAHQILHAAGHKENRLYYIENGFARNYYYDHRGNEHTVKFWEPGDIIFSYEGYYNVASYFYTEVTEESSFLTLSYAGLRELDAKFPEVSVLIKAILLSYQHEEYRKYELIVLPAEERYRQLRETRPSLFQKLPARIIASYLNMTRETLTRFIGKR